MAEQHETLVNRLRYTSGCGIDLAAQAADRIEDLELQLKERVILMTDQCKTCVLRGNIKKCQESECWVHEGWYAEYLNNRVNELEQSLGAWVITNEVPKDE